MSEYKLAKNILLQLVEDNFGNPYLWFYIGNCSYFLRELEEAVQYYQNAILNDSNMSEAYNNLACIYAAEERYKAIELLKKALSLRPNYMDAEHNMNQIVSGKSNYKITIRELRKVLTSYLSIAEH